MRCKLSLLLGILLTLVICSISVEQETKKPETTTVAAKKKVPIKTKDEETDVEKEEYDDEDEQVDDTLSALASDHHSRYTNVDPTEENYRMRPRWPPATSSQSSSSLEGLINGNDWSRLGYGHGHFPTASFDRNPLLTTSQSCHSLVDSQYIIFSDTCGAVPQARYSLPNSLGHRERWQIAQVLTSLLSSTTDPICVRSLRLLLCPVLFPPCLTRYEPPAVLPCQSYCRAIKSRCSIPALDILPCEILPHSSDLCPTNQLYSSLVSSGIFPSAASTNPLTGGYPSTNYPPSRAFPSLQSILSSQNIQSTQPTSPSANSLNNNAFGSDNLSPILVNFPPRSVSNENQQNLKYGSLPRSSNEVRFPTSGKSLGTSSVVRA